MSDDPKRIRDPSQLADLSVRRLFSWRAPPPVAIEALGTPLARVHEWERRLSQRLGACGCEHGGVGLLLGLALCLAYLLLRPSGWGDAAAAEWWASLGLLCATSTAGKIIGLRVAQRELQRTAREIRAQWVAPQDTNTSASVRRQMPRATSAQVQRARPCCGNTHSR